MYIYIIKEWFKLKGNTSYIVKNNLKFTPLKSYLSAGETQFLPIGDRQSPENRWPRRSSEIIPNLASFLPEHLFRTIVE